ncbi:MAG: YqhA family protein [Microcystaceae cyanobacterium]
MFKRLLASLLANSWISINIAVIAAFIGSIAVLIYGGIVTFLLIVRMFFVQRFSPEAAKLVSLGFIELIDLLLLGIVLHIIARGLYNMFIDDSIPLPHWVKIEDFEELKMTLLTVVLLLLGITFLGKAIVWNGSENILHFGIATGVVVIAFALVIFVVKLKEFILIFNRSRDKSRTVNDAESRE